MAEKIRAAAVEALERQIVAQGKALTEKWGYFLDAENAPAVTDPYQRYALAQMLENTDKVLSLEALQTTTVFGANYVKTMLGMTRQIFPRMFGQRLVSVQPMDRPSGQIFHLTISRDDGSTLGIRPQDDASGQGYSQYTGSKAYADHANGEGGAIDKGMKLAITSSTVNIDKVKKLKTDASWELQTDLAAVHGLSAMDLLQGAATDEIVQELDAEIVLAVRAAAIAHKTVTFGAAPAGETWTNGSWAKRISRAILTADAAIFKASLRHPNVMVVGIDAMLELMDLQGFVMAPNIDWSSGNYGLQPVGTLNSMYDVMLSRACPDNEILLGRRGAGFLDAGIVYSPYVALFISDRVFDVNTQKTAQSFASRYNLITVANTVYARIVLDPNATGIA
jgi:hypothetical protein